jgi:hypothetical protein
MGQEIAELPMINVVIGMLYGDKSDLLIDTSELR